MGYCLHVSSWLHCVKRFSSQPIALVFFQSNTPHCYYSRPLLPITADVCNHHSFCHASEPLSTSIHTSLTSGQVRRQLEVMYQGKTVGPKFQTEFQFDEDLCQCVILGHFFNLSLWLERIPVLYIMSCIIILHKGPLPPR